MRPDTRAMAVTACRLSVVVGMFLTMAAETLNCPMCGAAASSDSPRCEHCGARLATVACPSCFGMMFAGAKFCSHCGAKADRTEVPAGTHELCPRCHVEMEAVLIGRTNLEECPKCEGIWADAYSLQQICADREQQAAVLGMATAQTAPQAAFEEHIHYIPCPVCKNLMNRVNFAHCSNVIVNVCNQHGTWFDRDELRHIVEFIRAGGIEKERARETEELEERRRRVQTATVPDVWPSANAPWTWNAGDRHLGISVVASLLKAFLDR
jgi:Zn-finger nucleic acid-binding protein